MILVHCARVPLSLPPDTVARWIGALPVLRRPIIEGRLANSRGMESLTGMALLESLAQDCRLPALASLRWSERGRPEFPQGPEFSVTHAGGYAACAVVLDGSAIGIDMEEVTRARAATVRLVAQKPELAALSDGLVTPAELWTAKEAVIKAAGAALPDMIRVRIDRGKARFAGIDYFVQHRSLASGIVLSVATPNGGSSLAIRWLAPRKIFGCHRHTRLKALSA